MGSGNKGRIGVVCALEATLGGARKYCVDYLSRMDQNKYDLTLIYSLDRADAQFKRDIQDLRQMGIRLKEIPMVREIKPTRDLISFFRVFSYLRSLDYSIIHLHCSKAGFLGRIVSRIVNPRAITIYQPHMLAHVLSRWYLLLEKFAGLFTDFIIADSESEAEIIRKSGVVRAHRVLAINAGIDVDGLTQSVSHSSDSDKGSIVIGSVGRLTYPKDPITFIRAARVVLDRKLDAQFYWVGEGDLLRQSQEEIEKLGLQKSVRMLGWQDNALQWIDGFDIFVHSSMYEAFGLVVAEAMGLGKPVVASNISGVKDIVEEGRTGFLYEPGDSQALAVAIMELAANPRLRRELGSNGKRRVVERFSVESMVNAIDQLYVRVMR